MPPASYRYGQNERYVQNEGGGCTGIGAFGVRGWDYHQLGLPNKVQNNYIGYVL